MQPTSKSNEFKEFRTFVRDASQLKDRDEEGRISEFRRFVREAEDIRSFVRSKRISEFEGFGKRAKKLARDLRQFNILDTLGVARRELSHTRVICWLLKPEGTHAFGDSFLRAVMQGLGLGELDLGGVDSRPFQRSGGGFEVDVVVENRVFYMIIENKVTHRASRPQLSREFREFNPKNGRRFVPVYLTPFAEETPHKEFRLLRYSDVAGIIRNLLRDCRDDEKKVFLEHYLKTIGVLTMSEFREFGEKSRLYLEYYEVIRDFDRAFNEDKKRLFETIVERIEAEEWYSADEWDYKRTGVMIQIFKRNWKNELDSGAHYEFWFGKEEIPDREMLLYFHIEDGVGDRDAFAKELYDVAKDELDKLSGFQVKGGAPSFLSTSIDLDEENIVDKSVARIGEIAFLADYVDKTFEIMNQHPKKGR